MQTVDSRGKPEDDREHSKACELIYYSYYKFLLSMTQFRLQDILIDIHQCPRSFAGKKSIGKSDNFMYNSIHVSNILE